jgi:class 3 adenylate cyclase
MASGRAGQIALARQNSSPRTLSRGITTTLAPSSASFGSRPSQELDVSAEKAALVLEQERQQGQQRQASSDGSLNNEEQRQQRQPISDGSTSAGNYFSEKFSQLYICFADIVGFTTLSSRIGPESTLFLLNDYFSRLDELVEHFGLYKVETIGDAYMVAAGAERLHDLTTEFSGRPGHAMLCFSIEAMRLVNGDSVTWQGMPEGERLQIRMGVHTGECFGGVVGRKMPRYCLFGDTVNTSSRMESQGVPGKVSVWLGIKHHGRELPDY